MRLLQQSPQHRQHVVDKLMIDMIQADLIIPMIPKSFFSKCIPRFSEFLVATVSPTCGPRGPFAWN